MSPLHQRCSGKFWCNDLWLDCMQRLLLASGRNFGFLRVVYFLSSLRGQTAKTWICTKSGVSADSRKSAEKCRKVRRTALFAQKLYKKCAKSAVLRTFRHFSALFLESAETPLFVQINVFAVWPLRLDRKYTILEAVYKKYVSSSSLSMYSSLQKPGILWELSRRSQRIIFAMMRNPRNGLYFWTGRDALWSECFPGVPAIRRPNRLLR